MITARTLSIFLSFYLLAQLMSPSAREWRNILFPKTCHVQSSVLVDVP